MDIFFTAIIVILIASVVLFGISLIMLCFESQRKLALKIMIGCVVAFIIGFGACIVGLNLS